MPELQPRELEDGGEEFPRSRFWMSLEQKRKFCQVFKNAKLPQGYASNIGRCVQVGERKIAGYKSHDAHFMMNYLLPIAVKTTLSKDVATPLIRLCAFFKSIWSKTVNPQHLEKLQSELVETLCLLERIFPPAFFDIMVHLPLHLVGQIKLGGLVSSRCMYGIERYRHGLKQDVRNKARPEGSMAEGYLAKECVAFVARFLKGSNSATLQVNACSTSQSFLPKIKGSKAKAPDSQSQLPDYELQRLRKLKYNAERMSAQGSGSLANKILQQKTRDILCSSVRHTDDGSSGDFDMEQETLGLFSTTSSSYTGNSKEAARTAIGVNKGICEEKSFCSLGSMSAYLEFRKQQKDEALMMSSEVHEKGQNYDDEQLNDTDDALQFNCEGNDEGNEIADRAVIAQFGMEGCLCYSVKLCFFYLVLAANFQLFFDPALVFLDAVMLLFSSLIYQASVTVKGAECAAEALIIQLDVGDRVKVVYNDTVLVALHVHLHTLLMFELELEKYMVPHAGLNWVMDAVNSCWKYYKCQIKKKHFYAYDTDDLRWEHKPDTISDKMFQDLLQYWHTDEAKAISHSNKSNRLMLDDMHTLGRKSYAILRHELDKIDALESAESQEDGNVCNDPYSEVIPPPRRKSRLHLYGSSVKKSDLKNKDTKSSYILPEEFLVGKKAQLVQEIAPTIIAAVLDSIREVNPGINLVVPSTLQQLTPHDASSAPNRNSAQSGQSSKSFNQLLALYCFCFAPSTQCCLGWLCSMSGLLCSLPRLVVQPARAAVQLPRAAVQPA
uniref:DUF4218 domain-containing protein n=1 Tax=Chenopodium quinoa TaxID=63459 RepID=A0A803L750_CHEQI